LARSMGLLRLALDLGVKIHKFKPGAAQPNLEAPVDRV